MGIWWKRFLTRKLTRIKPANRTPLKMKPSEKCSSHLAQKACGRR